MSRIDELFESINIINIDARRIIDRMVVLADEVNNHGRDDGFYNTNHFAQPGFKNLFDTDIFNKHIRIEESLEAKDLEKRERKGLEGELKKSQVKITDGWNTFLKYLYKIYIADNEMPFDSSTDQAVVLEFLTRDFLTFKRGLPNGIDLENHGWSTKDLISALLDIKEIIPIQILHICDDLMNKGAINRSIEYCIGNLRGIQNLYLGKNIDDAGLGNIKGCQDTLQDLYLNYSKITGKSVCNMGRFNRLRTLSLIGIKEFNGEDLLAGLANSTSLDELFINETPVDKGFILSCIKEGRGFLNLRRCDIIPEEELAAAHAARVLPAGGVILKPKTEGKLGQEQREIVD